MRLFRGFASLAILASLAFAGQAEARGRWLRAESANFIVYSDSSERSVRAAAESLERFDALLRQILHARADSAAGNKLEVYLLRSNGALEEIAPGIGPYVAGFYSASPEQVAAFALSRDEVLGPQQILFHEYAHHFMMQHFAGAYPAWFIEGFAEYVQTVEFHRQSATLGHYSEARATNLFTGARLSLDEVLEPNRRNERNPNVASAFYAQSWLTTHYILSAPERREQFAAYLRAVGGGAETIEAFETAFGMPTEDFQRQLYSYARTGFLLFEYEEPTRAPFEIAVTRLPDAADDLLPMIARMGRMHFGGDASDEDESDDAEAAQAYSAERAEFLERVVTRANAYPTEPMAIHARAHAQLLRGEAAAARDSLAPLIGEASTDPEALYLAGRSYVDDAAHADNRRATYAALTQARSYFARVIQLDAANAPALFAYATSFPRPLESETLDILIAAHLLTPQVDDITFVAAQALIEADRRDEAIPLLQGIAFAPHHGALSERARALLDGENGGAPPAVSESASPHMRR
jgi:hypothetical protein